MYSPDDSVRDPDPSCHKQRLKLYKLLFAYGGIRIEGSELHQYNIFVSQVSNLIRYIVSLSLFCQFFFMQGLSIMCWLLSSRGHVLMAWLCNKKICTWILQIKFQHHVNCEKFHLAVFPWWTAPLTGIWPDHMMPDIKIMFGVCWITDAGD